MEIEIVEDSETESASQVFQTGQQRVRTLLGQYDGNQGRLTFTGRLTLDEFLDLTVVHNRRWAAEAGESIDTVTQRELIEKHADELATFILQGLVSATIARATRAGFPASMIEQLNGIQSRVGWSAHYGLPQVTLVLPDEPEVRSLKQGDHVIAARMILPAGKRFIVADGQHRREAASRVKAFLNDIITMNRTPKGAKFYPAQDAPLSRGEVEAWIAVQETFAGFSTIGYEAHIGLEVDAAKQLFTNYNCNVKPVKRTLSLEFDQANSINRFAKEWLIPELAKHGVPAETYDLRALASINAFLFLGKTSIKSAPPELSRLEPRAREFWTTVCSAPDWSRPDSLLREVAVLKGLAKAWHSAYLAKRKALPARSAALRPYIRDTRFDDTWIDSVPGLSEHTLAGRASGGRRFAPTHNDIVRRIVGHILG